MQEQINQQLPEGWKIVRLGDFVEKEKGKKPKNESLHKSDEFPLPYIDIQAFEEGNIKSWTDGLGCRLCSEDDLLMVWDGSRSGLVGKGVNGALGSTLMRISFSNIYNPYAFYFLQSKYQEINTRAKGSGTPHVDPELLWKYEFPIAPLEQQKKIVEKIEELFSELDSGIASLKTTQEQLKIYRQSLLKHAFEGKLTEQWRKDNPDKLENPEQLLARIQQEREARYQQQLEEWKQAVKNWEASGKEGKKPSKPKKLSDLKNVNDEKSASIATIPKVWSFTRLGMIIDEPAYGTSAKCSYDSEGIGVLRIPNVINGYIDDSDLKFASFDAGEVEHLMLKDGDLLTIRSNGSISLVGTCGLVREQDTRYIYAGYLIRLRVNKCLMLPRFLLLLMSNLYVRRQVEKAAKSTSGVNNINSGELQNLIVPIMTLLEQKEIVNLLEEKLSIIEQNEKEVEAALAKAELLRQSILKKAFSGRLV